jgi:putative membrane-bound dehydrogenase-like protein
MKRLILASVLLLVAAASVSGADQPAHKTQQVKLNGHLFTLPVGFEIELVAGPPLVDRPIEADFDEEGRLYVSDSSGSNEPVQEQLKKKPHRVVRLEDTKGNGHFDRRTVFADKLNFPEGVMWYAGSLYVAATPSIWKLTDTDGDGVADKRVEWFQGKTMTGCANDLHGPYLGPDGWIYWCKGAFAKQTYERPGKPPFVTRASHIFRARPDGSGIEPVMTGGMDNPVEVAFTPGGERIFTTTFFVHPGGGRRDGLIHAVYGGIYGKDHDVIYDHPWTSPHLMPVLTHMGAAAPCGLIRYESAVFGAEYKDNLFACQFNMHKVSRHILEPEGATFKTHDEDFLVSDNLDFHPTDVLEDADGSLLVIDTGGWYKLCCPTSQLHKPDVLGAIYRIRRQGAHHIDDPRGLKIGWSKNIPAELAAWLGDHRPVVRHRAIQEIAKRGGDAIAILTGLIRRQASTRHAPADQTRLDVVWALTQIDHAEARASVRSMLADESETIRQAAIHSVSVWRDRQALPQLLIIFKGACPQNRRAAAEALGRLGDKEAVPALLQALREPTDRALENSFTYALIEIADREGTAVGLKSPNMLTRRAALTALNAIGSLDAATVSKDLTSADAPMKETAWWIAGRHPEWGGELAGFLRDRLAAKSQTEPEREELVQQLARFAKTKPVQELLTERLNDARVSRQARQIVLRAMARAGLKETPEAWIAALMQTLAGRDSELVPEAVVTARALNIPKQYSEKLGSQLLKIGQNTDMSVGVRLNALAAVPGGLAKVDHELFTFLRSQLGPEQPVATRSAAVEVLSKAKLSSEQLLELTESVKTIGPMEIDRLLEAFAQSADEKVGLGLVAALKAAAARSSLRVETVKPRLAKFSANVQKQAEELYATLDVDAAKQRARLEQLLGSLKGGDIRRGQAVFHSTKAACASCHAIGYLGGNIGPDLTHIAKIRSERDLLESIVFPSASLVRSYEPVLVATKNGKTYNGLVRKDTPDEIVLALNATEEARIARNDIEDILPSKVSIMPAGLDQQLTVQELADLVAFLKTCK